MKYYEYEAFPLPTFHFVAGEQQDLIFAFFDQVHEPFFIDGYSAQFSVRRFAGISGTLLTKPMSSYVFDDEEPYSMRVVLNAPDTVELPAGKYVYQITLKFTGIPTTIARGIFYIDDNLDPDYTTGVSS